MTVAGLTAWLDTLDGLHGKKSSVREPRIKSRRSKNRKGKR